MSGSARTVQAFVSQMRDRLQAASVPEPLTDVRLLAGEVIGFSLTDFVLNGTRLVTDTEAAQIQSMVARRAQGEPAHRILGHREFYGLDFLLSPGTLEPRPDTEVLVDALLPHVRRAGQVRILDMGTGTGAICLSLLNQCPQARGIGSDIAPDALSTALKNAEKHGLASRFSAVASNWFDHISGRFDIIVSNPPYIRTDVIQTLDRDVRDFDPMLALDGGEDGLAPYRIIAEKAVEFLMDGGIIGVEIGYDQKDDVTAIFATHGYARLEAIKDYGGNDRALIFGR